MDKKKQRGQLPTLFLRSDQEPVTQE